MTTNNHNHTNRNAIILIRPDVNESFQNTELIKAILTKAAKDHGFTDIKPFYYSSEDSFSLRLIIQFLQTQREHQKHKVIVITNGFIQDFKTNDNESSLITLIKDRIIDLYNAEIIVKLRKIEVSHD